MGRTNICLSETEQIALDARAAAEGRTRGDVVRAVIDRVLNPDQDAAGPDILLAELAVELAEEARQLSAADLDLRVDEPCRGHRR